MILYHWWCDEPTVKPYQDMANPVVLSIAVLREHNKSVPVTVLDLSQRDTEDWGVFPELLNFKVVKWNPLLNLSLPKSSKLCSRVWDVWAYAHQIGYNKILFTDSDIFWLKNPLPLNEQEDNGDITKFYCSSNTGVWYFDKTTSVSKEVFSIWKNIIARVIIGDIEFFDELRDKVPTANDRCFQDEVAFGYLILQYPELYNPVGYEENYVVYRLRSDNGDLSSIKCLHGLGAVLGNKRGRICLVLKELKDAVERVLTIDHCKMIYGDTDYKDVLSIFDIKKITHQRLKHVLEFTGNVTVEKLFEELKENIDV